MVFYIKKILKLEYLKIFLKGSFMGIADMMPGISGSSIALILGIYDEFLASLKNIKFKIFFKFNFKDFFLTKEVKFLLNLFLGMMFSFIFFSKILNLFLSIYFTKILVYSFFSGLVLSLIFSLFKMIKINFYNIILILFGIFISFIFVYFNNKLNLSINLYFNLIIGGNLAIFFMLLPGVSGSFVLLIFGIYPFVIDSLANIFSYESINILFFLFLGMILGFLIYPRVISFLLKKFYFYLLSFLTGLMIGSIYGLWPFWSYKKVIFKNKTFFICDKFNIPNLISFEFLFYLIFILLGCLIFYKIKQRTEKKIKN